MSIEDGLIGPMDGMDAWFVTLCCVVVVYGTGGDCRIMSLDGRVGLA